MKSSKIKSVTFNNKTFVLTIQSSAGAMALPYSKLMLKPSPGNGIKDAYVDKELGQRCVVLRLKEGPLFFSSFCKRMLVSEASGK